MGGLQCRMAFFFLFLGAGGRGVVPCCTAHRTLLLQPGIEAAPLAVKAQSPNHWEFLGWHSLRVEPIKCQCSTLVPLGYVLPKKNVSTWVRQQAFWEQRRQTRLVIAPFNTQTFFQFPIFTKTLHPCPTSHQLCQLLWFYPLQIMNIQFFAGYTRWRRTI